MSGATYLVAAAVTAFAFVFIVVSIINAPVHDDDKTSCPPVDLDTEMRRLLDDRADWPDAS